MGSVVVTEVPSCSKACGIFLDQGSNLCLLHWQDSYLSLSRQGSLMWVALTGGSSSGAGKKWMELAFIWEVD